MLPWRWVPPAHSPISWPAILWPTRSAAVAADLERELAERYDARAVHLVDSGTSALALALSIASVHRGRNRVAMPAYGCFDLATAADAARADVALYDIMPRTLSADPRSLERAASGTAAVVGVHLYGVPCDAALMAERSGAVGAVFVEDAAQGSGATWRGRPLGAHGDLSVLSFGRGKGRSAGGGGALLVRDPALVETARRLVATWPMAPDALLARGLRMAAQDLLARPAVYGLPARIPALRLGETPYHAPHPGTRLSVGAAGLVRAALRVEVAEAETRRRHAQRLTELLPAAAVPVPPEAAVAGFLRFPVMLSRLDDRGAVATRRLGIERGYPAALCDLRGFSRVRLDIAGPWPGARALAAGLVTAPVHSRLTAADLERAAAWLRDRVG